MNTNSWTLDRRCPTECKLSHSDSPWKCIVKLHFSTDSKGASIPVRLVHFGAPITSKSSVEDRIRRAQRAILNPSTDSNKYLHGDNVSDENEVSFSKNYVSLEISGKGLADLSFVDLPGLIASVGRAGDERDIDLVKSLVTSYIKKDSCVILLTVACESRFCGPLRPFQVIDICCQPTLKTRVHTTSRRNMTPKESGQSVSPISSDLLTFINSQNFQVSSRNPTAFSPAMNHPGSESSGTKQSLWQTTGTVSNSPDPRRLTKVSHGKTRAARKMSTLP
jgi:hypothetical protein